MRSALLVTLLGVLSFGLSSVALHFFSPSLFRASRSTEPSRQAVEDSRSRLLQAQQESLHSMGNRPVYPYSIFPGGVKDARELKWAAQHDPVVAAHYAGFDYDHARIVRLTLARTVYVSYRIGQKVYWTRHRVSLHKGETLITDGKITGRTRCANRVEEVPQQATSSLEPPAVQFEEPVAPAIGTATQTPPVPFQSAFNRPPLGGPPPPLLLYDPIGPGTWIPLDPPPLPGVCGIGKGKNGGGTGGTVGGKKKGSNGCGPGASGGEVPEPSTWVLMISGLALIYWTARKKLART
ncbi:MAG: PEP-CTERM sorting domain-containing protein [Candidatus Sulfotelmatobacter sp.]